jgi:hypothetical protein
LENSNVVINLSAPLKIPLKIAHSERKMTGLEDVNDAQFFAALYRARAKLLQIRGSKQFSNSELYSTRSPLFVAYAGKELGEKKLAQCVPDIKLSYSDNDIKQVASKTYQCLNENNTRVQTFSNYMNGVLKEQHAELFPELSNVAEKSKNSISESADDNTFKAKLKAGTEECNKYIQKGQIELPDFHYCLLASIVPDTYKSCESKKEQDFADCVLSDKRYKAVEKRLPSDFAFFTRVFAKNPFSQ